MRSRLLTIILAATASPLGAGDFSIPTSLSPAARAELAAMKSPSTRPANPAPDDLEGWQREYEKRQAIYVPYGESVRKEFGLAVEETSLGDVPVLDCKPKGWKDDRRVLVYVHGGAYTFQSARSCLIDVAPVAAATGMRVISIDYTPAPRAKFQQITDQVGAAVRALIKSGYRPSRIGIYGESAGGSLAAGSVLKLRDQGHPLPGAVVLWSPWSDITETGDSYRTLAAAEPMYVYDQHLRPNADAYADPKDQKHPYVSPVYGDYSRGFPPTLIQGGTKEIFLSNFIRHYQAIDGAGQIAKLDLYDGMWHCFQESYELPEAKLALRKMKAFLEQYLK